MVERGKLFVVSAPSGAGKTTIIKEVLTQFENLSYSVSHTTRSPRKNERDGLDYFFITTDDFEQKISEKHWLEWAKVHDNYYGTSASFVTDNLEKGQHLLLDLDVQGAEQVMASKLSLVTIFIMAPSFEILAKRLNDRGTDSKEVIAKRLENAKAEIAQKDKYQYVIINDNLETAIKELSMIFKKETA
jgi:guanylate kinase